jgi:phosphoglycerate dehydrogenase-like enzyme
LEALLASSDYLILLAPLDDSTRGMIGRRQLEQVKQDAILVNTGRGALVDEEALCWALSSGKLAAAALDVYHEEPLPPDHPLLKLDTVIFAPHLGGSTYDCDLVLVTDVIRVLRGETPLHPL